MKTKIVGYHKISSYRSQNRRNMRLEMEEHKSARRHNIRQTDHRSDLRRGRAPKAYRTCNRHAQDQKFGEGNPHDTGTRQDDPAIDENCEPRFFHSYKFGQAHRTPDIPQLLQETDGGT